MTEKYRVHELVKFNYSDIGEYIDEDHTDRPLRNDILVELLNKQDEQIQELLSCNHGLAQKQIRMLDRLIQLEKENKQLKKELIKFKEWEKHVGDVKREELDRVFKMSIYEIAEGFEYYEKRIKELGDVIKNGR